MIPSIFFLHGLGSLPATATGRRLDAATGIASVKLAYGPDKTWETNILSLQHQAAKADANSIFVGESMGGFFAAQLAAQLRARCCLLNPVIVPAWQLRQFIGRFTIEGGTSVTITEAAVRSYNAAPDPRTAGTMGRIGLVLSHNDPVISPEDTGVYYGGWAGFVERVYDGHCFGHDASYKIIGDRIRAWNMDTAFPAIACDCNGDCAGK